MVKLTPFNRLKSGEKVEAHMHKPFWFFLPRKMQQPTFI
jgi:hypothetical protein